MTTVEPVTDSRLRVAVVGVEPVLESRLAKLLGDRAAVASHTNLRNVELVSANGPTVVVLGPAFSAPEVLEGAARQVSAQPHAGAVLVVDELSTQVLQRALRAGVLDVVAGTDVSDL